MKQTVDQFVCRRREPLARNIHLVAMSLVVTSLAARTILAETQPDVERAQRLFDEARALMRGKQYAQACTKLAESQELDPGGGTLLNLAICRQRQGRTATAFTLLTVALEQARRDHRADRVGTAERHLAELSGILSRLTVRLPSVSDSEAIDIALDGQTLSSEQLGKPMSVDPGVHEIRASQNKHFPWSIMVTIAPAADEQTVEVPMLEPEPPAAPEMPEPATASTPASRHWSAPTPLPPVPRKEPMTRSGPPRWLGYALTGVGVVGLGTGTFFGIRALTLRARSDKHFDGRYCTTASCVDDWNGAKTASAVSNVAIAAGIVTAGIGSYFLFRPTPKDSHSSNVTLSVGLLGSGVTAVGQTDF